MMPETTEDILELMDAYVVSAALGAAMELGVFWLLDEEPLPSASVAKALNIPLNRCQNWLQILCKLGVLESSNERYAPSVIARKAILSAQSRDTWAFQAREDRDTSLFVRDLALNIGKPMSSWQALSLTPRGYLEHIQEEPGYVARFTRKLCEIHSSLAEQVAGLLDLRGVKLLLDLGGGSGVVSFALFRRQPDLTSIVVDVDAVCHVGREIALEKGLDKRITYLAADFLHDDLPTGFDMVMLCDVGSFGQTLFRRIHDVLNPRGRLILVDKFAPSRTTAPPSRVSAAFLHSLEYPSETIDFTTADVVKTRLQQAGFLSFSMTPVPHTDNLPWNVDWTMLKVRK